MNEMAK